MAKIKQVKLRLELDTDRPYKETIVAINYDATDKHTETYRRRVPDDNERFFINLPKAIADALGMEKAYAGDQEAVLKEFLALVEKYKVMDSEVSQVILYRIEVHPSTTQEREGKFESGYRKVSVWAGTFEETVSTDGEGNKRYSYARVVSPVNFAPNDEFNRFGPNVRSADRFDKQVPWTEQNAEFFIWIKDNMDRLIERLHELEKPENMIETINAGRLLPLGTGEVGE